MNFNAGLELFKDSIASGVGLTAASFHLLGEDTHTSAGRSHQHPAPCVFEHAVLSRNSEGDPWPPSPAPASHQKPSQILATDGTRKRSEPGGPSLGGQTEERGASPSAPWPCDNLPTTY